MDKEIKEILKISNDFLKIPSVVGYEKPFLNYLEKIFSKLGYKTLSEKNYLVIKPNNNKESKYLLSAHIDRHGLILNDSNKVEYGAFYLKKKLDLKFKPEVNKEKEKKLCNYFNVKDINFELTNKFLKFDDFDLKFEKENTTSYIEKIAYRYVNDFVFSYDTNTGKKLSKFKILRYNQDWNLNEITYDLNKEIKGEVFAFDSQINLKENLFFGQIDNVISVAVLYYILKKYNFEQEIIFTTGEEIGVSYKNVLDYMENEKQTLDIITLDTSPYENFENKKEGFLTLRKGDENGKFNIELVNSIEKYLNKNNIAINFKSSNKGMTELGRISTKSKGELTGATIQLPTMNYHTTYETSTIKSLKNYFKIIKKLSENSDF